MSEGYSVLPLNQVEIPEGVLTRSNSPRVVGLGIQVKSRFKIAERLIGMALFKECPATTERSPGIGLRFDYGGGNAGCRNSKTIGRKRMPESMRLETA